MAVYVHERHYYKQYQTACNKIIIYSNTLSDTITTTRTQSGCLLELRSHILYIYNRTTVAVPIIRSPSQSS